MANVRHLAIAAALMGAATTSAMAKPAYARKEKKQCAYCHSNPSGGGARNARGMYYEAHGLSFAGFKEEGGTPPAGKAGAPAPSPNPDSGAAAIKVSTGQDGPISFKSAWKTEVSPSATRVNVGDLAGGGAQRLLTLDDKGTVTVLKFDGETPMLDGKVDLGAAAKAIIVGPFEKGKPDIIAAPGMLAYKEGDAFKTKKIAEVTGITGIARFVDGEAAFFYFDGAMPVSWGVNRDAVSPLVEGRQLVPPDQAAGVYRQLSARLPEEIAGALQLPEASLKFGFLAMVDVRGKDKVHLLLPWADGDAHYVAMLNPEAIGGGDTKPVWKSEKLGGKLIDFVYGVDPKGSKKNGILALLDMGAGKAKVVEFLALE